MVAEVFVLAPVPGPFSYEVPGALSGRIEAGARVWVPLGGRSVEGVVLCTREEGDADRRRLRPIKQCIEGPGLPEDLLRLAQFIAEYYLVPPGEALRLIFPPGVEIRERSRVRLTAAGRDMAMELRGALLSQAARGLEAIERRVISTLGDAPPGRSMALGALMEQLGSSRGETSRALHTLVQAGLLCLDEEIKERVCAVSDTLVERAAAHTDEDPVALRRSPARRLLWQRILREGPLRLSELRREDPRARGRVMELAAAGLVTLSHHEIARDPFDRRFQGLDELGGPTHPLALNEEQASALRELRAALEDAAQGPSPTEAGPEARAPSRAFLLHGVTGSGKTEIYMQLIAAALERGRTALMLVPEIGLTPQLAARFRSRFGADVAVLHSALTPGERADSWRRLARGELRIALGPRSALFAPLHRLGVIIVDEEHDTSFKQQDQVRYHGRDVALVRARLAGAVAVLGSATPSLEALMMARTGKLRPLRLRQRATGQVLPTVEIVDLKQHLCKQEDGLLSAPLVDAIEQTLSAGEQVILFLNRRGYAPFVLCQACGQRFECINCAVTLTFHKGADQLLCHYCGHAEPLREECPRCHARALARLGVGTQRIEERLAARFPGARIARLDRDTAQGDGLPRLLHAMHARQIDVLVGTQMLAKGHDFPFVTLVGVVLADTGMGLPDFRASERTFQLLAQVAGRAGRASRPGRVIIQTYSADHPAIRCACAHDYDAFAEAEIANRSDPEFPPLIRLAALRVDGADPEEVRRTAYVLAQAAEAVRARAPASAGVSILGPAAAPLSRLKGKTRWQVFVRARSSRGLHTVLRAALRAKVERGVRVSVDVDPVSTL